jgi:hypothetical protein
MATEKISQFFERLGFKLRNERNSWGAINNTGAVMLRSWSDEMRKSPRRVRVFTNVQRPGSETRTGRNERKVHLRSVWVGGIPAYTVIVMPKFDNNNGARNIGEFRSDAVFPIERLIEEDDLIFAVLGAPVSVENLAAHMQLHKIEANANSFPQAIAESNAHESAEPVAKAAYLDSEVREYLIDAASRKVTVTYGELFDAFELNRLTVAHVLTRVGHACLSKEEPILTVLVVLKKTGRCSTGMEREFGVNEDEERLRVFQRWSLKVFVPEGPHRVDWADEELQAAVASYAEMMRLDAAGKPYVKAHYYRQLAQRFGRVEGAFERRMQNISYLLDSHGLEWLQGLKPQENIGPNVEPRLLAFLDELFSELASSRNFPEDLSDPAGVIEGAKKQVIVNAYERDSTAKSRCIKRWGCACVVCAFDFHSVYGELGKGFIHVHHLKPIHTVGEEYMLDPENDLRPVCPNCHSMLHRKKNVLSIEELAGLLKCRFDSGVGEMVSAKNDTNFAEK